MVVFILSLSLPYLTHVFLPACLFIIITTTTTHRRISTNSFIFLAPLLQDFTSSKDSQETMDEDIVPVVLGPSSSASLAAFYITDDHHTLSALDYRYRYVETCIQQTPFRTIC